MPYLRLTCPVLESERRRTIAERRTPLLVELFGAHPDAVNVRFRSYPPTAFAVGGRLLSDRVPRPARWAKRVFG